MDPEDPIDFEDGFDDPDLQQALLLSLQVRTFSLAFMKYTAQRPKSFMRNSPVGGCS